MALTDSVAVQELNDRFNQLRAKYYSMPERDRISIVILILFILAVAFYYLAWRPINQNLESAKERYHKNASTLEWVKSNETAAKKAMSGSTNSATGLGGQSLLTVVNQTASRNRLRVKRVEPKGEDSLRVWFDEVPFNDVMGWLNELSLRYGLSAASVNIEHKRDAGMVNVSLIVGT